MEHQSRIHQSTRVLIRLVVVGLLLLVPATLQLGGCTTTIVPPRLEPGELPATIYLTDYGRHTGLVLPVDEEKMTFVEYAYGEWAWFANRRKGPFDAIRALFLPSAGTIGRRYIAWPLDDALEVTPLKHLYTLDVRQDDVAELIKSLDARYDRARETEVYNYDEDLFFVRDDTSYWLLNNCNPVLAGWLRELDCGIRGFAVFSSWRIADPPQ